MPLQKQRLCGLSNRQYLTTGETTLIARADKIETVLFMSSLLFQMSPLPDCKEMVLAPPSAGLEPADPEIVVLWDEFNNEKRGGNHHSRGVRALFANRCGPWRRDS